MSESLRQRYDRLQLDKVLNHHRGLRIVPNWTKALILSGSLSFEVSGPAGAVIEDAYDVEIRIPAQFPQELPWVRETRGRIPRDYHKLKDDLLCLGAPTAVRLRLTLKPTLPALVNELVIPYLYGYSFFSEHGRMPYGELPHGDAGVREHLASMFGARASQRPEEFLRLAAMKKRPANKEPCPCGSGRRLGLCHNRNVNRLRSQLGRQWFQAEHEQIVRNHGC